MLKKLDFMATVELPEKTKSLIRTVLVTLATILGLLGLTEWTGFVDIFLVNLDSVWAALSTIVGFVGAVIAFFQDGERFNDRAEGRMSRIAKSVKK